VHARHGMDDAAAHSPHSHRVNRLALLLDVARGV